MTDSDLWVEYPRQSVLMILTDQWHCTLIYNNPIPDLFYKAKATYKSVNLHTFRLCTDLKQLPSAAGLRVSSVRLNVRRL